jgi:hypothetical protein
MEFLSGGDLFRQITQQREFPLPQFSISRILAIDFGSRPYALFNGLLSLSRAPALFVSHPP